MVKHISLARQALTRIGKNWSLSSLTREKILSNTKEFAQYVAKSFGLERIENLKPGHVQSYVENLHARGLSASTMADKLTAVRMIASAIGKQNIVERHNAAYGIVRSRINPQAVNHDRLVEVRQAISARADQGDRIALMVRAADSLRVAFGLRAKESLMSSRVELRGGKLFIHVEGAKGGRPRQLEARTEGQQKAIQLVTETARALGSGTGRIIPTNMTLKQAYDAQRNLWRECGGTRACGANMHGERHSYARERDAQGAARSAIMSELGHGEDRSPSAYLEK
ncbi:MAG: integrase domain-containing protein [Desulfuromonadales bacterium]|nr:integrase domain-containing protein [Desulfuromonadales bacterium]